MKAKIITCTLILIAMMLMAYSVASAQPILDAGIIEAGPVAIDANVPLSTHDLEAMPPIETVDGAIKQGGEAIKAAQQGLWWHFSALVVMGLMFVLKKTGVLARLGRAKYIVLPLMSVAASLLAAFQGGVSWEVAASVFTAALSTGKFQELWEHGVLGIKHGINR